jgi:signal transduction histidine kinase/DNA-binding response OmpR family regulator
MQISSDELLKANDQLNQQNELDQALLKKLTSIVRSLNPANQEPQPGQPENLVGLVEGIEELVRQRKTVEDALRSAGDAAQAANQAKGEFLANMSHEIRTPMNAIIGMTSILLDHPLAAEPKDCVETIRHSADTLLEIINDILDFSKIEAGHLALEAHPLDLRQTIEQVMDLVSCRCAEKGIELAVMVEPGIPRMIVADNTRLRQVLVNLVNNAVKFTHQGGVTLSVSMQQSTPVLRLHFSVEDTGIGISPAGIERLFKSFSQVDSSITRKYGGTGLGLAISKPLVKLMGGTLLVSSEPGHGSRFEFAIQASAAPEEKDASEPLKLVNTSALLIEHNPLCRLALAHQLSAYGIHVVEAETVEDALERLASNGRIQWAILDPRLRGAAKVSGLASRVVHFFPRAERDATANSVGFFSLHKPVKPRELETLLRALMTHSTNVPLRVPIAPKKLDAKFALQHPLHVLVVEDNPVNTKVLVMLLNKMGYRPDTAGNGLEALQCCSRQMYDLIIMDMQMPEMDGIEATREIRKNMPLQEPPFILGLSANVRREDRDACLTAGMHDFISKPVRPERLMLAIENAYDWIKRRQDTVSNPTVPS